MYMVIMGSVALCRSSTSLRRPVGDRFASRARCNIFFFFFSSRRRHTRYWRDWSSDVCSSDLVFLYTFFYLNDEEELALRVLNHKFGESSNSILFREIRENKGLAYDIYTQIDCSDYIKSLYIYTGVEDENIEETIKCIYDCIENIKNKNIVFNDRTLTLMKKIFKTSLISTLEDASELSQYVLIQVMENRDIYEFIREMESLEQMKSEDIYNIAKKVLNNPTVHILKRENNDEE